MACDVPEPCKFPSLDSCQKRFLWTHKGVDLAPHPVVKSCAPSRRCGEFPQAFSFEGLDPCLRISKQGPCFTAIEEDGDDERIPPPKKKKKKSFQCRGQPLPLVKYGGKKR